MWMGTQGRWGQPCNYIKTSEDTHGVFPQCTTTELVESAASRIVMEIIEDRETRFWGSRVGSVGDALPIRSCEPEFRSPAPTSKLSRVEWACNPPGLAGC